jgi:thiosulfate/3-mercaptopyruvate sulfurtransferase
MVTLVEPSWVLERLGDPGIVVLDPGGRMKYLRGHLKGAINLNVARIFGDNGRLLPPEQLAELFGSVGLGDMTTPVLYDSYDGQRGAMLAWALEYLGSSDVHLMDTFYEGWVVQGHEIFYRPVEPSPRDFRMRLTPGVRSSLGDVKNHGASRLLDVRSLEEFTGQTEIDARPGHIPGALNLVWSQFLGDNHYYLDSAEAIKERLSAVGVSEGDSVIAYCRVGMRAAVGYLALQRLGYDVRLYDGSYAEWTSAMMPVETSN